MEIAQVKKKTGHTTIKTQISQIESNSAEYYAVFQWFTVKALLTNLYMLCMTKSASKI